MQNSGSKCSDFLSFLYSNVPCGLFQVEWKNEPKILNINETALEYLRYDSVEEFNILTGGEFQKVVYVEDDSAFRSGFESALNSGAQNHMEVRLIDKDDKLVWFSISAAPFPGDETGSICQCILTDITARKKAERKFELEAKIKRKLDPLTGLYNLEAANDVLQSLVSKNKQPSCLFMFSFDSLEEINREYSYSFGDAVILNVADCLRQVFNSDEDIIARISSGCFLIYSVNTANTSARFLAEKLRGAVEDVYIGEKSGILIRICIGAVTADGSGNQTYDLMYSRAEACLYRARAFGGNAVVFYDDCLDSCGDDVPRLKISDDSDKKRKGREAVTSDIKSFAFNVLENTPDSKSAVKILLKRIGKEFNLNRIAVFEVDEQLATKTIVDEWVSSDEFKIENENTLAYTREDFDMLNSRMDSSDIYEIDDNFQFYSSEVANSFLKRGVKSLLAGNVYDEGKLCACITFEDCVSRRVWTDEERAALHEVTRSLSRSIIKRIAFNLINNKIDPLTNLSTQGKMVESIRRKYDGANKRDIYLAYISADIRNFRFLNAELGFAEGDRVLREFARRISTPFRGVTKFVSRIDADVFVTVIELPRGKDSFDNMIGYVERINARFSEDESRRIGGINITVKTGVYLTTADENPILAIDKASAARRIRGDKRDDEIVIYDDKMESSMNERRLIENSMVKALENGEFFVCFQPKIDLQTNQIIGAEALVRWKKEDGGIIMPNDFIPLFEDNGFITKIDFYVLKIMLEYQKRRIEQELPTIPVSVNLSGVHSRNPKLADDILSIVDMCGVPHELCEFEITETVYVENTAFFSKLISKLRRNGFKISLDDFGTGYSSLSLLGGLPADTLKIDRELLWESLTSERKGKIIKYVVSMAKDIGFDVICEGVENRAQADMLMSIGCYKAQGFYFGTPMPIEEFIIAAEE